MSNWAIRSSLHFIWYCSCTSWKRFILHETKFCFPIRVCCPFSVSVHQWLLFCFLAAVFTFRKFYVPLVKKIIETISIEIKVGLEEFKSKCVLLSGPFAKELISSLRQTQMPLKSFFLLTPVEWYFVSLSNLVFYRSINKFYINLAFLGKFYQIRYLADGRKVTQWY